MKIAIVTDSGSDIYREGIDIEGVYKLPLQISSKNKIYLEGEDTTNQEIYDLVENHELLKTSLPPIGKIEELFRKLKDDGYDLIFAVPITTGLSSTLSAMHTAAQEVDIKFDYIDCYSTYGIQLHLALSAREMFNKGYSVEVVKERLQDSIDNSVTFVLPKDLMHLARGGRLTSIAAALGGLLKISPILYLNKTTLGKIDSYGKTRTMVRAFSQVVDYFVENGVGKGYKIFIAHVRNVEGAYKLKEMFEERISDVEYQITELITTVGVHTGIGTVATQFIKLVNID